MSRGRSNRKVAGENSPYGEQSSAFFRNVERAPGDWQRAVVVPCRDCDAEEVVFGNLRPAQVLAKQMAQKGWATQKVLKTAVCPNCQKKEKKPASKPDTEPAAVVNHRHIRRIMAELETYFDEDEGAYRNQMSDRKIAEELDLSEKIVAQVREEAFGSIRVDPLVADLQRDIASAMEEIDRLQTKVLQLSNRLDQLSQRSP